MSSSLPSSSSSIFDQNLVGRKKQCIWIIRYGLTKYPIMEEFDTDLDPNEGMEHAACIAKRLYRDPDDAPAVIYTSPLKRCAHTAQLLALAAPQNRHHHHHHSITTTTTSTTSSTTSSTSTSTKTVSNVFVMPVVRVELGLTEWLTPDLLLLKTLQENNVHVPRCAEELAETYGTIDLSHVSLVNPMMTMTTTNKKEETENDPSPKDENNDNDNDNHANDHYRPAAATAAPSQQQTSSVDFFPFESEQEFLQRCATTMTKLLELHATDGSNLALVSHAPCDQALAFFLLQQSYNDNNSVSENNSNNKNDKSLNQLIAPWPLGGITKFSRLVQMDDDDNGITTSTTGIATHDWTMECYGDTSHLPGKYKNGIQGWSLPCFRQD